MSIDEKLSTQKTISLPKIIQGGMGVGTSSSLLAKTVSMARQLGVVSGTGVDTTLVRRLQDGDPNGDIRRAMEAFPFPEVSEKVLKRFFIEGGKDPNEKYRYPSMFSMGSSEKLLQLTVLANFVEVFLAKEGHDNPIGVNYLEKIQLPHLSSIYGAMLAGVDYVLMGAGIPRQIPGVLDKYASKEAASYNINVTGAKPDTNTKIHFDPKKIMGDYSHELKRPDFLAIVSSFVLAKSLHLKATGKVNGFVVEEPPAGGHNAPPRGKLQLNGIGEPIYGKKDEVEYNKIADLGVPFWLAGGYGNSEGLQRAKSLGAEGIQVGSLFSLCEESGVYPKYKEKLVQRILDGEVTVFTDPRASPTNFPFKVVIHEETLSEEEVYENRERVCDIGYLREPYLKEDGKIGYRCASEPIDNYLLKEGDIEDTVGRKCICNGLLATIGNAQIKKTGKAEPPIITAGDNLDIIKNVIPLGEKSYTAQHVLDYLMQGK